ncbi:MAG: nucleoside hydrolase [Erysipelotrichia bacterium]|nr:nucleoside hydrolase [Erysipelotrichia bacterium]
MRKLILDTDVGSDDAVAIIMTLKNPEFDVLAITTVSGNVDMQQATLNALQILDEMNLDIPVYMGERVPLKREIVHAENVHGPDGMGGCGLIHPQRKACQDKDAVEAILELVKKYPDEIEIAVIGPATNIAKAILKDPETMSHVKTIYSMGTAGFGEGNTTPVAEFNVFADAEAYQVMLNSGIKTYIAGIDTCFPQTYLNAQEMDRLVNSGNSVAKFAVDCNKELINYFADNYGIRAASLPDAVALGCMMWEDIYKEAVPCNAYVCVDDKYLYGQVVFYSQHRQTIMNAFGEKVGAELKADCYVYTGIDADLFRRKLCDILLS